MGGAMYAQYRTIQAAACLVPPDDTTAVEGASCFVNPQTSLGMVETMRREGHTALVHTAAASNLGQMLNKVCLEDGVGLVNIVRSREQAALLRGDRRGPCLQFHRPDLHDRSSRGADGDRRHTGLRRHWRGQVGQTDPDSHGGGRQSCRDRLLRIRLDRPQASISLWPSRPAADRIVPQLWHDLWRRRLAFEPLLAKIGPERAQELRIRVASSLKRAFASHYVGEISLFEALDPSVIAAYGGVATGTKYVINPSKARSPCRAAVDASFILATWRLCSGVDVHRERRTRRYRPHSENQGSGLQQRRFQRGNSVICRAASGRVPRPIGLSAQNAGVVQPLRIKDQTWVA